MMKKFIKTCFLVGSFFVIPLFAYALSGANTGDVEVKVYTKQGNDWFKIATKSADQHGVLELKDAIPGWYKMVIDEDDEEAGQTLAVRIRMRDAEGRRIDEKTDVEAYVDIGDVKTYFATYRTDDSGWIELSGLTSGTKYYLDVDEEFSIGKKEERPRIKVKAKVDDSEWFQSMYKRTEQGHVLEVENVLPAKYKFKYKSGDAAITDPFTLKIRMLDEDGEKIKEPTDFKLYAYVEKQKVPVGTLKTDARGWLLLPGTMTGMKYKISMAD